MENNENKSVKTNKEILATLFSEKVSPMEMTLSYDYLKGFYDGIKLLLKERSKKDWRKY